MKRLLILVICALCGASARAAENPNIPIIVSDDQGYADAGFQGSKQAVTPHLDALAKSGMRGTSGYVTFPINSPSRAELLVWRMHGRQSFAIREGKGNLIRTGGQPAELYDLASDPGEKNNAAATNAEIATCPAATLEAWNQELIAPLFPGSPVKDEDRGPGGANQKNAAQKKPAKP